MRIKNAQVYGPDFRFAQGEIAIEGELFAQNAQGEVLDATGLYAIPGLIDIHFHGCMGHDFCDATPTAWDEIFAYQARQGITAVVPAAMTLPAQQLEAVFRAAGTYKQRKDGAVFAGINMEGPYFAAKRKGAHKEEWLKAPDYEELLRLNQLSGGKIKIVCVAPELKGGLAFIRKARQQVPCVSIAHTEADYETAMAAFAAGANHVTHLYNAMPPLAHRAPGVIGAALDSECMAELICDGIHIHPSVLRATFGMFTASRLILISDSMNATGLPNGSYALGGQEVTVKNGLCTLEDGTIAGSATHAFDGMRQLVKCGIPLEQAVRTATYNPAKAIGEELRLGSIAPGKLANLVLLDADLNIHAVFVKGKPLSLS